MRNILLLPSASPTPPRLNIIITIITSMSVSLNIGRREITLNLRQAAYSWVGALRYRNVRKNRNALYLKSHWFCFIHVL